MAFHGCILQVDLHGRGELTPLEALLRFVGRKPLGEELRQVVPTVMGAFARRIEVGVVQALPGLARRWLTGEEVAERRLLRSVELGDVDAGWDGARGWRRRRGGRRASVLVAPGAQGQAQRHERGQPKDVPTQQWPGHWGRMVFEVVREVKNPPNLVAG
jgi:hypothetical protein